LLELGHAVATGAYSSEQSKHNHDENDGKDEVQNEKHPKCQDTAPKGASTAASSTFSTCTHWHIVVVCVVHIF